MDFHIINAPHEALDEPPKVLLAKGFQPPFRSWLKIGEWHVNEETGKKERQAPEVTFGIEDSIQTVLKEIDVNGPFDGILSFSQGSIFFRHMYRIINDIDKPKYEHVKEKLPKFIISVCGLYFPYMKFQYNGQLYQQNNFTFDIPSLHIYGKKDEYKKFMNEHELYSQNPVIIYHEEGHKFPKQLTQEDYQTLIEFIKQQYIFKFGNDDNFKITAEQYSVNQ